jgi:hypothetical protein
MIDQQGGPMTVDITAMCARAYNESGRDRSEAARVLAQWTRENPDLDEAIVGNLRIERCWELIRNYERWQKRTVAEAHAKAESQAWQPSRLSYAPTPVIATAPVTQGHAPATYRERVGEKSAQGIIAAGVATLLYRPLPNGRKMVDAKGDDLQDAVRHHRAVATENARNVRYYTAVWATVGSGRVGDAMTEDALRELWQSSAEER